MMVKKLKLMTFVVMFALWCGSLIFVYEAGKFDGWNEATAHESCDVAKRVMFFGFVVTEQSISEFLFD